MSMLKLLVVHDVFGLDKHLLISFLDYFECLNGVLWLRDGRECSEQRLVGWI